MFHCKTLTDKLLSVWQGQQKEKQRVKGASQTKSENAGAR